MNKRLQQLQGKLGAEACLIENPIDLRYFTGLTLSRGELLVTASQALLRIDGRYLEAAEKGASIPVLLDEKKKLVECLRSWSVSQLRIDPHTTSYARFLALQTECAGVQLLPELPWIKTLRVIKDPDELKRMRKSAALNWKGLQYIHSELKEGITEKELAKRFEIFCLQNGAQKLGFEPIIAFGARSAMPHYQPADVPLKVGDSVLVDIGVVVEDYHSDMTRVLFFGPPNPTIEKWYALIQKAHDLAFDLCKPGVAFKELDLVVRALFREHQLEPLFTHSLGHGLGLQIHEYPRLSATREDKDVLLEENMVFTIEPGLYQPGVGGVRYENTICLTAGGPESWYPLLLS